MPLSLLPTAVILQHLHGLWVDYFPFFQPAAIANDYRFALGEPGVDFGIGRGLKPQDYRSPFHFSIWTYNVHGCLITLAAYGVERHRENVVARLQGECRLCVHPWHQEALSIRHIH